MYLDLVSRNSLGFIFNELFISPNIKYHHIANFIALIEYAFLNNFLLKEDYSYLYKLSISKYYLYCRKCTNEEKNQNELSCENVPNENQNVKLKR